MLTPATLKKGGHYNWIGQPERLVYLGAAKYEGDSRVWFTFGKVQTPNVIWSEVRASDLVNFEETKA